MEMEICGRHMLLFDEDATSAFVNSTEALVPWSGNASLLIDRYDVRHLLQRIPPPSKTSHTGGLEPDGVSSDDLDKERYLDLPNHADATNHDETPERAGHAGHGTYQAVPFSYSNDDDPSIPKHSNIGMDNSVYHPPFSVPEGLHINLPPTEKLHQIIARTALFVSKHGGQSEIVLRVKQGDNPTFGFLMPEHNFHPYFRYLVDHPELIDNVSGLNDGQEGKNIVDGVESRPSATAGGALSLLGSVYSSEDEDEDAIKASETRKTVAGSVSETVGNKLEKRESSADIENQINLKSLGLTREKILSIKKSNAVSDSKARVGSGAVDVSTSRQPLKLHVPEKIVEPPSSLKQTIEKIVEFILKNGKEFEKILMEQDRSHGRFPFLLPSNCYHSYYLKVLKETHKARVLDVDRLDAKNEYFLKAERSRKNRGKKEPSPLLQDDSSKIEELPDSERKEKFKMFIGYSKKDTNEPLSRPPKQPGVSADVAAAIVMAATRGGLSSPTNLDVPPAREWSGVSLDAAAAIVMEATRGSVSQTKSDAPEDSFLRGNSTSKQGSFGKVSISALAEFAASSLPLDRESHRKSSNNVVTANVIAKTAAIAAASEADSSEASMTKEQKQKAERLKRAKMFAAMIKKDGENKFKLLPSGGGQVEPPIAASGSLFSGPNSDLSEREREGSSVHVVVKDLLKSADCSGGRSRKHISSSNKQHNDDSEDDQHHQRKRHRSEHTSHSRRDNGKHKRHRHSSSKHHSTDDDVDDEDEYHRRKKSKSRHRHHRHHRLSDDEEYHRSSHCHRRKSHADRLREDIDDVENTFDRENSEGELTIPKPSKEPQTKICEESHSVGLRSYSDALDSSATEVSEDLRAKVRAMLLATM